MSDLVQQVRHAIDEHRLLEPGRSVLVAVSGGLDSMVLLNVLHRLSGQGGKWRLVVAHLNHKLRGRESDADEKLVVKTAESLGLEMVCEKADIRGIAAREKLSLEMAGRKARHGFLARVARRRKIQAMALAHHADDQLELFFLRLLRGSGGEGLWGMRWARPSPEDSRLTLVRPLLAVSKAMLEAYARENGIRFREDASNDSLDFQRNRVRHELLPVLRAYQPALESIIPRVMAIVGADAELARVMADEWLRQKSGESTVECAGGREGEREADAERCSPRLLHNLPFSDLSVAVQRRVLHQQLLAFGIAPEFGLVEDLRENPGKVFSSKGIRLKCSIEGRLVPVEAERKGFDAQSCELDLTKGPFEAEFGGCRFRWRIVQNEATGWRGRDNRVRPDAWGQESFDAAKVGEKIVLRHWQPGDRFQRIGVKLAAKLQDVFTNSKVPREKRRRLVIAATASGEIFWVEGQRISERFKLTAETGLCLNWAWNRSKPL